MLPPRAVAALGALSYRDEPVFVEKRPPAGMAPRRRVSTPVPIADARKAATSRQQSDVPASTTSFPHTTYEIPGRPGTTRFAAIFSSES